MGEDELLGFRVTGTSRLAGADGDVLFHVLKGSSGVDVGYGAGGRWGNFGGNGCRCSSGDCCHGRGFVGFGGLGFRILFGAGDAREHTHKAREQESAGDHVRFIVSPALRTRRPRGSGLGTTGGWYAHRIIEARTIGSRLGGIMTNPRTCLVVFPALVLFVCTCVGQQAQPLDLFQQGSRFFLKGDYQRAIAPYSRALEMEKTSPALGKPLWYVLVDNLGMSYGITGDLPKTMETFGPDSARTRRVRCFITTSHALMQK